MHDAKRYLSQLHVLKQRISVINEQIDLERSRMTSIAIRYDKLNVQSSGSSDPMADYVASIDESIRELTSLRRKYTDKRRIIEEQISGLIEVNDRYAWILLLRYVDGIRWDQIADKLGMTRDTIVVYHGKALNLFLETYGPFE